jgi:hypothetical protein
VPTTCAAQGKNCGSIPDGCGGTLSCGTCASPQTCGGGGVANVCGSNCIAMTTATTDGHHNPGMACLDCHVSGGAASSFPWTAAGTLYNNATGGAAIAGATIELVDANNQTVRIVTSTNGNFYTLTPLTYPVKARASGCPNDVTMSSPASSGNCNSCHGSTMRVHLP